MFDVKVSIDVEEIMRYLQNVELGMEQAYYLIDAALRDGMDYAVDRAKELAPVDTGRLRDSIRQEGSDGSYTFIADPVNPKTGLGYAQFPEYGTSRQVAQPYARPAVEEAIQKTVEQVKTDLSRVLLGQVWGRR